MQELTDKEYEIVIFAIRVARVRQIPSVKELQQALTAAFPDAGQVSIDRAIKHIANRVVASELDDEGRRKYGA